MARTRAFTLIELLVVIALVSLLLTLLLPSLETSREASRRVVCTSNMRQIYQYFYTYQNERGGWLPINSDYTKNGDTAYSPASTSDDDSVTGVNGPVTNTGSGATGWAIMLNGNAAQPAGYSGGFVEPIPPNLVKCPSYDDNARIKNFYSIPYGYRYNSDRVEYYNCGQADVNPGPSTLRPETVYGRDALNDMRRSWRPLITDAAGYRRAVGAITSTPWDATSGPLQHKRWSHTDGGNYLRHDGAARWAANSPIFPGRAGWPWTGTVVSYSWPTSNTSIEVDAGLDQIFMQGR